MGFDVEEYRKNRKNQQSEETKKSGFDVETYRKSRYAPQVGEEIASRVNSWLKSNESLVNSYNARYGENSSSYRADYSDWLSNVTTKTGDLEKEADAIKSLLGQYSDFYDSDSVKSIIEALDSSLSIQKEIVDNSTKDYEYWSQWKDEGAYKRDMADWLEDNAEVDEDKIEQRREVYQSNLDRIAELEAEIEAYRNTPSTNDDEPFLAKLGRYLSGMPSDTSIMPPTQSSEETALQKMVSELDSIKAENRRYDREQKSLDDYFVPETEEFLQNAASRDYGNPTIDDIEGYWNSTDTSLPEPTDKLGFYLNNYLPMLDEIESRQKDAASRGEDYRTTMPVEYVAMYHEGYEGSWEELEDREINIYYNLLKTEGQEAAYKFLDDMKPLLNKRATQTMSDKVSQAELFSLEQIFYNVASVPANIIGGAASFMDDAINIAKGNDINPYSSAHRWHNVAQAVRQDTANDINEATGNAALPYLGTTFGDVYQALMSGADSLVGIGLGGTTYGILMGMGAASSEAKELYEKGASIGQMAAGGILAGAAEMVFEKVSIDKFVKMGDTKSMKALLVNTLKQGGVEASEEMLTEIANTLTDAIVMGSQSDLQGYLDKYVSQGYTESQAIVKALFNDVAPNVINAGIGGLISGGGMGSIGSIGSYANYQGQVKKHGQSIIDNGGVDTLKALALDMAGVKGSTNAKSIGNLAGKVDSKASAKNVGRLSVKIEETMGTQNTSDIQTALTEKGLSKSEANRVAALLTTNAPLTEEQQAEIEGNEKIAEVVKELVNNKDSVVNQRKLNLLAARLGVDMKNSTINAKSTKAGDVALKNDVDVSEKVSKEGKTTKVSTGEVITINKNDAIAKTKVVDGERVVYYNTDHGVVEATDVTYANKEEGILFEGFSDMNPAFANAAIKNYDGSMPVQTYVDGMREGIVLYGMHNFQAVGKDISRNSDLAALSEADQSFALKLGRAYAKANANKSEKALKTAIKNAAEKAEAEGKTSTTSSKKGGVRFENGTRAKTSAQKRVVNLAKHLSRAIGIDIVFYDARTTKDKNGKGANGYFDPKDNSIHLDLQNAVTDSKTIVFTLSHELVHFIKKWSPAKYNTFSKFLMEQYAAHGVSTSTLLANKMAALGTTDADLSYEEMIADAYEEMIADACERMLLDSNAVVKLMELRKTDLELFEKIKLHVLELLNKIRDAFKGVDPNTDEGIALQKMEDVLGKLHEMFEDAAVDAAKNYQVAGTLNTESVSVSEDGTIQMQMKQYQQTGRSTLLNYLKGQYGDNNANDLISTIDSIYNVMAEIKEDTALSVFGNWQDTDVELDAEGRPIFTTSINNGDYELNQDFSRVCKKRRQLNFVLNMLAEDPAFEASHLTKSDFVKINKAIKEHGFEIACALCFVDSKRFRQAEWADSFANTWNDILGSMKADSKPLSRFNFATKSANMADEGIQIDPSKPISYRKWSDGKATETRHYKNLDDLLENDGNNNVKAIARLLRDNPNLRHEFRGADIIASDGFDMIQRLAPDVRGILDGWGGSSVPKPSSNDAIYDNSILNIDGYNAEKAFAVGGVRMNSFSDFMAHMFFDYAQAFADLSAKNLPMHSYTKELDFARLFGLTGGKVNMSAIAAIRSNAPNIDKIKDKTSKEAAKDFEKSIAGLDISRLAEKLGKSESEITYDDVIQNLDDVDYVWADESIDVKSATLLQTGILYDNLTDAQAAYCYELIRNGQIEEAFRVAGEKNVNRGYAKHLGIITVGVSRAHILKLLRDPTIRMVIPYHKSGLNPAVAKALNIAFYDDFTDVQNTSVKKGDKQVGITGDDAKVKWKNPKNGKTENKKLKDFSFYDYFGKTVDGAFYDGKATAAKYIDWCENGVFDETVGDYVYYLSGGGYILASELHAQGVEVVPKFSEFASEENYYKLVEDFDCYDTITGEHSAQEAVDFFHDGLPADYKDVLTRALKAEQKVHDDFKDHLDNKGLRDEIMDIVKPHGYTPSDLSATWGEIVEAVGEENVGEATEQFTDVENTATIKQQKKTTTNRTLLANALESAAQNDIERNKLALYKSKIDLIEAEQAKLAEVKAKANELRFTKGRTPEETKQMKALDFEAKQIENRIHTYDRQLLNLESTAALKNVLQREKEQARKREAQKGKEALAAYKEKAAKTQRELMKRNQESRERNKARVEKTALRSKIRTVVKDLNSLLKNGNKKRNIKEEMQDTVASSLALADILFNDDIRNEDIVRLGVDSVTAKESEALNKYRDLLEERDRLQAKIETIYGNGMVRETLLEEVGKVTEELDKANGRIAYLNNKLSDLFERERARLNRSTVDTIINDLITEYAKLETSENGYIKNAYSDHMKKRLETLKETLQGKIARDMDIYQLSELYDTFKSIEHMIRHSNSLFREGRLEDLMTNISNVQGELYEASTEQKDGGVIANALESAWNEFTWNNLRPVDAFERLGSPTLEKLFWDFVHAMGVAAMDVREAGEVIAKAREKYGYSKWNMNIADTPYTTRDGLTFKPSLADKLSIYAYSQRDQAEDHMVDGGFTYDTGITYKETENGKTYVRRKLSNTYRLSKETIGSIIGSLTQEQRDYVDAILPYLTDMGKKGNEVSMVMYGIELFGEMVYFPLQSSRDYMSSTTQTLGATPTMSSLANSGFTHQTKPGADNPIVLRGFDDVVLDHIEKMSNYHALVLPIENLRRVFDNVSRDTDRNSIATKALIGSRFGVEAQKYFEQWLTDINGGIMPSGAKNFFGKLFSRAKGMSVAANLSVVAQQYSSIIRAMEVVDPKYFAPFLYGEAKKSDTKQYEELLKYAPIAIIKEMGGFDVGSKGRVKDYIGYEGARKDAKYINKKIDDLSMWGAGAMDKLGWVTIWKAIKAEVASEQKLTPGTDAFYEACKLRFTEVVTKTQVYDSVASRSGYMRSQHDAVKYATSFMGEPTAIVGRYFGAGVELVRAIKSKNKARVKSAAMRFGRTATVIAVAGALGNLAKALVYAGRDDDEDEALLEKWMGNFAEALKDDLIPLNYLPFGRDLVSIIEGWDVERPDTTLIADMVTSVKKMADGDVTLDDSLNLVGSVGNFFGKPLKNVIREIKSAINFIGDISDDIRPTNMGGAFVEGFTGNERTKTDKLYDAIMSGDRAHIERLKSGYKDDDAYLSALRTALKENDPRVAEAVRAYYDGDVQKRTSIIQEIEGEGYFSSDVVRGAINNEITRVSTNVKNAVKAKERGDTKKHDEIIKDLLDTYPKDMIEKLLGEKLEDLTNEEEDIEKSTSVYRPDDINTALDSGDTTLAREIIADLISEKTENNLSKARKEAEESGKRFDERNAREEAEGRAKSAVKASVTSHWKPLYVEAYKTKNTKEQLRIIEILLASGLYGRYRSDVANVAKSWAKEG